MADFEVGYPDAFLDHSGERQHLRTLIENDILGLQEDEGLLMVLCQEENPTEVRESVVKLLCTLALFEEGLAYISQSNFLILSLIRISQQEV